MLAGSPQTLMGKLEPVDIRRVWETEAGAFTPWLARHANITLLAETIGIELEVEAQEKAVGPFRADILCKDIATDNWVLIENQLERTDHTHLGQLLTYAAGLDAVTIVWVSPNFTEEHRATLDWLNKITDSRFNFFGLEIEAWRIGDSPVAPKFNIISKPNDWASAVRESALLQADSLTEIKRIQLEYWIAFKQRVDSSSKTLRTQKPAPHNWMNFAIGRSGFNMNAVVNTVHNRIAVNLVISGSEAKTFFKLLRDQKEDIEGELGLSLQWRELPEKGQSRIKATRDNADPTNKNEWPEQHEWLLTTLEAFRKVFSPRIKSMTAPDPAELLD
jgi:hypothetical protein